MALFRVTDFIMYNSYNNITGVSWEVSKDSNFNTLIDKTYDNKDAIVEWSTPLIKSDGSLTNDDEVLYVRCKVHIHTSSTNFESKWFSKVINNGDMIKKILIKDRNKVIGEVNRLGDGSIVRIW